MNPETLNLIRFIRVFALSTIGLFPVLLIADIDAGPNRFAFTNVMVIDSGNGVRVDQTVYVEGQTIVSVGDGELPPGVDEIDARDKYLIPGLWDVHVHLTFFSGFDNILDLFLANGVTSVRDTGGGISALAPLIDMSETDPTSFPRIYASGPLLDGELDVYSGSDPMHPPIGISIRDESMARNAVSDLHEWGAAFFKAYEMLYPEAYYGILRQAKAYNKPVTGHVPLSMDAVEVAESGISSLEHLRNLELSCSSDWESLLRGATGDFETLVSTERQGHQVRSKIHRKQREVAHDTYSAERCEEVVHSLKENGVFQVPTLALNLAPTRTAFRTSGVAEVSTRCCLLHSGIYFDQFTEQALKLEPSELDRQTRAMDPHRAMALLVRC